MKRKRLYSQFKDGVRVKMYLKDNPGWITSGQICHDLNITKKSLGQMIEAMEDIERQRFLCGNALVSEYRYIGGVDA